ncbi:peptide ABC transporter substrate-binding protein [Priestia megaterium]|uniref:peptide ABC transporter substrate-binding protein n=1 Tax=Priestia megaterium TaxID=1404 RepID=UPI002E23F9A7|nr:peptide ABC transporter substrate-binding protein [Priestia megaterium]
MKKRLSILFSLLLVMSLFLAACGFNKESGGSENASSDGGEKKKEQELRVNIKTEPFSLNPGLANDSTSSNVLLQTFEGLTRIGKDGKPENAMAKDVKVSDDQTKYTFTIRDDAKWYTNAGENYTSNGPFKLKAWKHNDKIELVPNENYWDKDAVKLKKVEMYMINDNNTELSMFKNGELDWAGMPTGQLPADALPELKKDGSLNIQEIAGTYWYKFNTEQKPLDNVNIRKALAYAIDRKGITEQITKDGSVPAMAAVPPTMFEDNKKGYFKDNDVKKAKEYLEKGLKEMGLKDASELPAIKVSYNTDEKHAKIAQAVQDMWKKNLGIKVQLDNSEWAVYIEKLHQGDYQVGRMGWLGDFNDPINFLELFRDKKGGNNDTNWENPEYKKLLIDSQKETDPKKRQAMLKKAEGIFMDEMPVAPIYFYTNAWVQDKQLKDVVMSGLGDIQIKWAHFE